MITAMLSGNLGNHMFNYAIARTVAELNGYEWGFDPVPKYDYHNGAEQMNFMEIDYGKFPNDIKNVYNEVRTIHNGDNVQVYNSNVFDVADDTDLVGGCWQSEQYYNKEDLRKWFKIKETMVEQYENTMASVGLKLDDNVCIINFRGGEYRGFSNLIIRPQYYIDAMNYMKSLNPNIVFVIITDDPQTATQYIPNIPVMHFSIGMDYYIINKTKNLILANSSFSIMPTILNKDLQNVIAPKYWARHNVSDGYWAIGDQYYKGWSYMNRDGILESYEQVKHEAEEWRRENGL